MSIKPNISEELDGTHNDTKDNVGVIKTLQFCGTEELVTVSKGFIEKILSGISDFKKARQFANEANIDENEFILQRKEKKFQDCIRTGSSYALLKPGYFDNISIWKTLLSAGVGRNNRTKEMDIIYKQWLGEKLHLTSEEYESLSMAKLHKKVQPYINSSIDHVNKYLGIIPKDKVHNFRSSYYGIIHDKKNSLLDLLNLYIKIKKLSKNAEDKNDYKIALFEIQRLFALTNLYRDMEQNHENQSSKEDQKFIVNKLLELLNLNKKRDVTREDLENHQLCSHLNKRPLYIKKNQDGSYSHYYDKPIGGDYDFVTEVQEGKISGLTQYYKSKDKSRLSSCFMRHILFRGKKGPQSTVDKFLMKKLYSFTEIPDNKGLIIVLDSYKDAHIIEKILTTELGTKETSWIREIKFYPENSGNPNSSNNYTVRKGTIKIVYKAKDRKNGIQNLQKAIKSLEQEYKNVKRDKNKENNDILKNIKKEIEKLKNELRSLSYNIELEIQIFDMENYIKAEVDEFHPAYHETYKKYQRIFDVFPKLFPKEVYGEENLRDVIMPVIEEKFSKEKVI